MAEYRDQYPQLKAAGVELAAISVDEPRKSGLMAGELRLPFPVLSDSRRNLITAWGLLNEKEMGGIAFPAVFAIDSDLRVQFRSVDSTTTRADPAEVAAIISEVTRGGAIKELVQRRIRPGLMFLRALMNAIRRGVRTPWASTKS